MKKVICLLAVVALFIGCVSLSVCAGAAPSPQTDGVVSNVTAVDASNNPVTVKLNPVTQQVEALKPTDKDDATIGQYDLVVDGTPTFPVTVTADVAGVKTTSKVYVIALDTDNTTKKIEATVVSDGKIKFVLDKAYAKLSIVADKQTATSVGVSEKTGDNLSVVVAVALVLSAAGAVVAFKKIED